MCVDPIIIWVYSAREVRIVPNVAHTSYLKPTGRRWPIVIALSMTDAEFQPSTSALQCPYYHELEECDDGCQDGCGIFSEPVRIRTIWGFERKKQTNVLFFWKLLWVLRSFTQVTKFLMKLNNDQECVRTYTRKSGVACFSVGLTTNIHNTTKVFSWKIWHPFKGCSRKLLHSLYDHSLTKGIVIVYHQATMNEIRDEYTWHFCEHSMFDIFSHKNTCNRDLSLVRDYAKINSRFFWDAQRRYLMCANICLMCQPPSSWIYFLMCSFTRYSVLTKNHIIVIWSKPHLWQAQCKATEHLAFESTNFE